LAPTEAARADGWPQAVRDGHAHLARHGLDDGVTFYGDRNVSAGRPNADPARIGHFDLAAGRGHLHVCAAAYAYTPRGRVDSQPVAALDFGFPRPEPQVGARGGLQADIAAVRRNPHVSEPAMKLYSAGGRADYQV